MADVLGHGPNDHRRERDKCAGEEAVEDSEGDEAGLGLDGDPAEHEDAGADGEGDGCIDATNFVGEEVWNDSAKDGSTVHDGEEVEGGVAADALEERVRGDVEEGDEDAEEAEDGTDGIQVEGGVEYFGELGFGLFAAGGKVGFHDDVDDDEGGEDNEGDDADGPGKADVGIVDPSTHEERECNTSCRRSISELLYIYRCKRRTNQLRNP